MLVAAALFAGCATVAPPAATPEPLVSPAAPEATPLQPETAGPLKVIAVGDIMLDGTARPVLQANGYDYAFAEVRRFFKGAHIVIGNLEGPLTTRGAPEQDKTYVFRSPPDKVGQALRNAGFTAVSLANNHTLDFGADGLASTIEALDAVGIAHIGAGPNLKGARKPVILEAAGTRVALLAYSLTLPEHFYAEANKPGTAFGHEAHVRADVAAARNQADVVLVSFHWGQEGKTTLREYQTRLGRVAIDAGAAAVFGHHPHILQGIEHYKGGVILYSLGNFTFGSYSQQAQVSAVAELTFDGPRVAALRLYPINVNNFEVEFQPKPLAGANAARVVEELRALSAALKTEIVNDAGTALLRLPTATARTETPATAQ
ncbi:MAG TPA: CapA family protein [Acidiferrobacterales bacterium]|nr:CapA family protein [Acidiferrobacterales bacterium]